MFVNASLSKASLENERNALWIKMADGTDITCVQVAGLIARRILCYVKAGDNVARGQRYGFIRFGSRVDVYLPTTATPKVAVGDKVYASADDPCRAGVSNALRTREINGSAKAAAIRRRGIYWLPNLFTTVALFAGFFAIVQAMNGRFEQSALAIFVAMVLDGLDGRVARLTHTQSAFGAEYDSLSDMVSFGAAPALVIYIGRSSDLGTLGWIAAFIYCAVRGHAACALQHPARQLSTSATSRACRAPPPRASSPDWCGR